jgi:phosphatidylethanolamine-binding protein (PEBP) family uncharacterized protein
MELISTSFFDGDTVSDFCALVVPADPGPVGFAVHAADVDELDLGPGPTRADLEESTEGHVLDSASVTGLSSLNPRVR